MTAVTQQPGAEMGLGMGRPKKNVPAPAAEDIREWSTGLCSFCTDCKTCCLACCCMCCVMSRVARRLNESCCVAVCLDGGMMALRTKLRMNYGIKGSVCGDWCAIKCCFPCAVCQMDRELREMGR